MKYMNLSRYLLISLIVTFTAQSSCLSAEDEHTPLGEQMEQIGSAWRTVKRSAGDASKNAQTLAQVNKMIAAAKASQQFKPDLLKDIPDAEKELFVSNYAKGMKLFITNLEKLAKLLESGDNAGAQELVTKLDNQRQKAHDAFRRPE